MWWTKAMMTAYKPAKGIPRKGMREQLRGERRKLKPTKVNKRKEVTYGKK